MRPPRDALGTDRDARSSKPDRDRDRMSRCRTRWAPETPTDADGSQFAKGALMVRRLSTIEGPRSVLVADDDETLRFLLVRHLVHAGFSVREARDGDDVLELLRSEPRPSNETLVLDVHMPGRTGIEIAEALRRDGDLTPIVLMTGHRTLDLCASAKRWGVAIVLEKPFETATLETALANAESMGAVKLG